VLGTRCFVLQVQRSSRDAFALPFHEETALLGVRKIPFLEVSPGDKKVFEKSPQMQGLRGPSPDVPGNRPNCIQPHARSIGEIMTIQTPSYSFKRRSRFLANKLPHPSDQPFSA
jgi:hypothetical protein